MSSLPPVSGCDCGWELKAVSSYLTVSELVSFAGTGLGAYSVKLLLSRVSMVLLFHFNRLVQQLTSKIPHYLRDFT